MDVQPRKKGQNPVGARTRRGTKENPWPEVVRERMRAAKLEATLIDHVNGVRENMSATQVRAALGLLNKILPDLTEQDLMLHGDLTINIRKFAPEK